MMMKMMILCSSDTLLDVTGGWLHNYCFHKVSDTLLQFLADLCVIVSLELAEVTLGHVTLCPSCDVPLRFYTHAINRANSGMFCMFGFTKRGPRAQRMSDSKNSRAILFWFVVRQRRRVLRPVMESRTQMARPKAKAIQHKPKSLCHGDLSLWRDVMSESSCWHTRLVTKTHH